MSSPISAACWQYSTACPACPGPRGSHPASSLRCRDHRSRRRWQGPAGNAQPPARSAPTRRSCCPGCPARCPPMPRSLVSRAIARARRNCSIARPVCPGFHMPTLEPAGRSHRRRTDRQRPGTRRAGGRPRRRARVEPGASRAHPRQARRDRIRVRATNDWDADPVDLTGERVEELARREHDRWQDERRQAAWRSGPVRDADTKLSPYLVPWDELTEDVRNLDRDAIRLIPLSSPGRDTQSSRAQDKPRRREPPRKRPPAGPPHPRNRLRPHQGRLPGPGDPATCQDPTARRRRAGPTGPGQGPVRLRPVGVRRACALAPDRNVTRLNETGQDTRTRKSLEPVAGISPILDPGARAA